VLMALGLASAALLGWTCPARLLQQLPCSSTRPARTVVPSISMFERPSNTHASIVFLRHGQSTWNEASLFTGWADVELTALGKNEAATAATSMWREGITFDLAFTSRLKRAYQTLDIVLDITDQQDIPVHRTSRLNERMYGALTGLNKKETTEKYGEAQVKEWRRSYSVRPPDVEFDSPHYPGNDNKYCHIPEKFLPRAECLKDTVERALPFWHGSIEPALKRGKTVLVAAHGNSIRGLLKYLDDVSEDAITSIEIPTAVPLVYHLDEHLRPIPSAAAEPPLSGVFLADEAELKAKQAKVAAEASAPQTWACIGEGCLMLADEDLTRAFAKVDSDGDGLISFNELEGAVDILSTDQVQISAQDVAALFNEVDLNGDGVIDFEEFVAAVTKTEPVQA